MYKLSTFIDFFNVANGTCINALGGSSYTNIDLSTSVYTSPILFQKGPLRKHGIKVAQVPNPISWETAAEKFSKHCFDGYRPEANLPYNHFMLMSRRSAVSHTTETDKYRSYTVQCKLLEAWLVVQYTKPMISGDQGWSDRRISFTQFCAKRCARDPLDAMPTPPSTGSTRGQCDLQRRGKLG